MKIVVFAGSPRKGGNTDTLADEFIRGAREAGAEIEKVYLDDYAIRPIGPVGDVLGQRVDTRADDDFPRVFESFLSADVVCFATPVYWQGVSAQTKCFIDRFSAYIRKPGYDERIRGKGYVVITAFGAANEGRWVTEPLKAGVKFLGGRYLGDLCVQAYKKGDVTGLESRSGSGLAAAFELGRKTAKAAAGEAQ